MIIGKRLNGRYKILDSIGGGGMANVYRAIDMILDREVAVKVLRPEFSDDEEFIRRFRREAQAATSLSHENIVSIYDVGEEDSIYYIVMEYVEGTTLKKYIQQYAPVPVDEALRIMRQLASAIGHAHDNHVIHRDIKPQNILVDRDKNVKITDFGIAMALSSTTITHTNSVLGSVHYLSPEQARGGLATNKSDIYALGIVLFELLTGRLPFSGESAISIALKHLQTETPSPKRWNPDIPQSVENIVLKATAKDPFHRYESIEDLQTDLDTSLDPDRINEQPFAVPEEEGEKTKAIPIVTDEHLNGQHDDTIVHNKNGQQPKMSKGKRGWKKIATITIIVLLLLAGATAAAFTVIPALFAAKDVTVPDVVGSTYEEAVETLTEAELTVEHKERYDDEVEAGYVIKTDPKAGSTVKEGYEVTIYESLGKEMVEFDDYIGENIDDAKKALKLKGFNMDDITINEIESEKPVGEILDQITPYPGEKVVPEETSIEFDVSKGLPLVTIPDMMKLGWTEDDVNKFAVDNNLSVEFQNPEYSENVEKGLVMYQDPKPFTKVERGSGITVKISKGPEPKPPKEVPVTLTVPYEPEEEGKQQLVKFYVEDLDHSINNLYDSKLISSDLEFKFTLTIPYEGKASYRVVRDEKLIIEKEITYEEVQESP